jgi:hypothetical protein
MPKEKSLAARIREYQNANPSASPKDVAATLNTSAAYVYVVRNIDKKKKKKFVTLSTHTSNKSLANTITMVEDEVTKLTDEQQERLAFALSKPRVRMQAGVDNVNHPSHYKVGGIETIDFIEAKKLNYNIGNVVKYITRADHKGNRKEDLLKAQWYLNREIEGL